MKFELNLRVVRRTSREGKKVIAPYINGWNVWELPEKHWTPEVQMTIQHAYMLGRERTLQEIREVIGNATYSTPSEWGDIKDETK